MSSILDKLNEITSNDTNDTINESNELSESIESNQTSFNIMVNYIRQHHEDIPEGFRGSVMFDNNNLSLAVYWVYAMKSAPVPVWMRHDPNIVDNHGWTIAQHYITVNKTAIVPEWMIHDSKIQNSNGRTTAMVSLLYRNQTEENNDLPNWMIHDINIFDSLGYSLVDYWLANNSNDLPDQILDQIDDKKFWKNKQGENIGISYMIRRNTLPPEEFRLTNEEGEQFKTVKNNTYNDFIKLIKANT